MTTKNTKRQQAGETENREAGRRQAGPAARAVGGSSDDISLGETSSGDTSSGNIPPGDVSPNDVPSGARPLGGIGGDDKLVIVDSLAARAEKPVRAADRIRQTAWDLFYHQGIRAVGVDEIVTQAGVTKPSLYRNFASKDELAAAYLRDYDAEFCRRLDAAIADHPGNPKEQILSYLRGLGQRASQDGYRGCGLSNAAVEYPEPDHPARLVAIDNKRNLRQRLRDLAREMGADDPDQLGDGLLLLLEGTYSSGQLFGAGGPAVNLASIAEKLIAASGVK